VYLWFVICDIIICNMWYYDIACLVSTIHCRFPYGCVSTPNHLHVLYGHARCHGCTNVMPGVSPHDILQFTELKWTGNQDDPVILALRVKQNQNRKKSFQTETYSTVISQCGQCYDPLLSKHRNSKKKTWLANISDSASNNQTSPWHHHWYPTYPQSTTRPPKSSIPVYATAS